MRGSVQNALRLFTRAMRPLALRSAGKKGSNTSVVRHVGRRSGKTYQTPVIAVQHDDSFLIALPYGKRTDWLKNILDRGSATIVTNGHTFEVDRPEVIPMAERPGQANGPGAHQRSAHGRPGQWGRCEQGRPPNLGAGTIIGAATFQLPMPGGPDAGQATCTNAASLPDR